MDAPSVSGLTFNKILVLVIAAVIGVLALLAIPNMYESLDAKEIMVIQFPRGELVAFTEPGIYTQWFGTVTKYPRRVQYSFNKGCKKEDSTAFAPQSIRFNDGGHATLCGAISWEMPMDPKAIIRLHKEFNSAVAIEQQLIGKAIGNAAFTAGPMMSSTESSGARRAELTQAINDQTLNGIFETKTTLEKQVDPLTKAETSVTVAMIVKDEKGNPKRISQGAVSGYGLTLLPMTIDEITYEKIVEDQIAQRQQAITQVQISQANARRAEQDRITVEQQGMADAAKAKWAQEVTKAQKVTEAQQKLEVATLSAKAAEQYKREQILVGEGDAERKKLVMAADGALDQKLITYKEVMTAAWTAIGAYQGNWVPQITSGGGEAKNGALSMLELVGMKAARDLGIDMSVTGAEATANKHKK